MPRRAKEMTQLEFKRLKAPETGSRLVAVGGVSGLHLHMASTGARSWILRAMVNGKRKDIGLGSAHEVSLGQARDRARQMKDLIWQGDDPVRSKSVRAARITFTEAVDRYLVVKLSEFRNSKHRQQWRSTLDTYAIPLIGDLPVADIAVVEILQVLSPIWLTKTESASRLRGRIENVLAWATVNGHRSGDNPARWRGNLDATLPKPSKVSTVKHRAAVPSVLQRVLSQLPSSLRL